MDYLINGFSNALYLLTHMDAATLRERGEMARALLNQRRESDKWRTAYAELSLRARQP